MTIGALLLVFGLSAIVCYYIFGRRDPKDYGDYRRLVPIHAPYNQIPPGVRLTENFFENSRGQLIYSRRYTPVSGEVKAVIGLCHGFGDSISWFLKDTAVNFVQSGFAVICMDYPGHGKSDGLHAYIPDFNALVFECRDYVSREMKEHFPSHKLFLFGESLGGAVAMKLASLEKPLPGFSGCVLCAPMCKIADALKPPKPIVDLAVYIAPLLPEAPITPSNDVIESAFKDPSIRALARNHPIAYTKRPRLGTALELLRVTAEIEATLHQFSAPFLVLHGTKDIVTDAAISEELHRRACSKDKTVILYKDAWHALLLGDEPQQMARVFNDITSWLDARL